MRDGHLCWPPYIFLGPAVANQHFISKIATGAETNYLYILPVNEKPDGVDGELSTP